MRSKLVVVLLLCCVGGSGRAAEVTLGLAADDFQFPGDWVTQTEPRGITYLITMVKNAKPAVGALHVSRAGTYHVWVRSIDYPNDRPGTRTFSLSLGGKGIDRTFGKSNQETWTWEQGGTVELQAGPLLIALEKATSFARFAGVLLTTDARFKPTEAMGKPRHVRTAPLELPVPETADPLRASPVVEIGEGVAKLENEVLRMEFLSATRDQQATIIPRVSVKAGSAWRDAGADGAAEAYVAVTAAANAQMKYTGFYPSWSGAKPGAAFDVELGGAKVQTRLGEQSHAIWNAGEVTRFVPKSAVQEKQSVRIEFHPSPVGQLTATWELRAGEPAARLRLRLTPGSAGQYSLGYHLFCRRGARDVEEVLLPMMWQRRRLPARPHTLLDPMTPTPISLVQARGPVSFAVAAEPEALAFAWPNPSAPSVGLNITDALNRVQPSLYGPVLGTGAAVDPGKPVELSLRVLAVAGDWYAGYRSAVDSIYRFRDYRKNHNVSLSDAMLNMVDLMMDDQAGGWWERGQGPIQIETKNGVTQSSPMLAMSVYRMSGDEQIYRRRALPTMQYALSRGNPHFSPIPDDTGPYPAGDMNGPARMYGTATFAGLHELTQRRNGALLANAFGADGIRAASGYGHTQPFDDYLAKYLVTGEEAALANARELADAYIRQQIDTAPAKDLGVMPFFFISFVPDWEGLLQLYEVTGEKRYLDAAAFGARQLMTGVWTQPVIPAGDATIHPTGQFPADGLGSWRLGERYRLGSPRKENDTPTKSVPAWLVSNVGLSFEQPTTYRAKNNGRLIYQMGWSANFLRLAHYTADKTFETYARNAVVGRWANYPGYYAVGFTDLPNNPRYPYEGPDVTDFYYHHITPHLAWTIDYLFADAFLHSGGKVRFPSLRQFGYAYFDSRIFGHAPGEVFDEKGVWPWLRRGLVQIDNPQLNALTAHNGGKFFVILTNQDHTEQGAAVRFLPEHLRYDPATARQVTLLDESGARSAVPLENGVAQVRLKGRSLAVLVLEGVKIEVATHVRLAAPEKTSPPLLIKTDDPKVQIRAAALQAAPGTWNAYIWCTASPREVGEVTVEYTVPGQAAKTLRDGEYPYEFSIPTDAPSLSFKTTIKLTNGQTINSPAATLQPAQ